MNRFEALKQDFIDTWTDYESIEAYECDIKSEIGKELTALLEAYDASKWNDGHPDDQRDVIITEKNNNVIFLDVAFYGIESNGWFYYNESRIPKNIKVLKWCELPKPYNPPK